VRLEPPTFCYQGRCPKPVRLEETSNPRLAQECIITHANTHVHRNCFRKEDHQGKTVVSAREILEPVPPLRYLNLSGQEMIDLSVNVPRRIRPNPGLIAIFSILSSTHLMITSTLPFEMCFFHSTSSIKNLYMNSYINCISKKRLINTWFFTKKLIYSSLNFVFCQKVWVALYWTSLNPTKTDDIKIYRFTLQFPFFLYIRK
jgi:hypothetical protein